MQQEDKLIGTTIAGKYKIVRKLGQGGMGQVYQGEHLLLERQVAVKFLKSELEVDERVAARFMREAKTAAKLEHPHAVTIYDYGIQDELAYIVMEYISGKSLREWLSRHGRCDLEHVAKWMSQVCDAVSAAHTLGIIHRDLKPENIMLKQMPDGSLMVKVVDFGLAKMLTAEGQNLTKTNEVIGTPYYMAPEFYEGESIDHRADIYALGIICYEMLTGEPPYTGTLEAVIAGHLFKPLPELPAIPKGIVKAIEKATAKKREERYSNATEFANDIIAASELSGTLKLPTDKIQTPVDKVAQQTAQTSHTLTSKVSVQTQLVTDVQAIPEKISPPPTTRSYSKILAITAPILTATALLFATSTFRDKQQPSIAPAAATSKTPVTPEATPKVVIDGQDTTFQPLGQDQDRGIVSTEKIDTDTTSKSPQDTATKPDTKLENRQKNKNATKSANKKKENFFKRIFKFGKD
ncbi:MAG: serine/threonine-protein kinase [Acidobacteriota bacterium]|nr:serine/threonine protein kinase [Blastocatellia bacterium]MDW8411332.1 serine/threonine-protein kinase [Acidobacteriota bacterium]